MTTELHIYDFDGTLFKSPDEPSWWAETDMGNWFQSQDSLGRPCVPDHPDDSWWVASIVAQAKKSLARSDTWTVLCTGRNDHLFGRWRVPELLKQKGLDFDQVLLNNKSSVRAFKALVMKKLLEKHPDVKVVQAWDDRPENIQAMEAVVVGRTFIPHLVPRQVREPDCTLEDYLRGNPYTEKLADRVAQRWVSEHRG